MRRTTHKLVEEGDEVDRVAGGAVAALEGVNRVGHVRLVVG